MKFKNTTIVFLILFTLPFNSFASSKINISNYMFKESKGEYEYSETELDEILQKYNDLKISGSWTPSGTIYKLPEGKDTKVDMSVEGEVDGESPLKVGKGVTDAVIKKVEEQLGKPYIWGGVGPRGFDCSGLMQYAFKQLNVDLPRNSRAQAKVGKKVNSMSDLKKGDLVFFDSKNRSGSASVITHVGVYVGNGDMIHAPKPGDKIKKVNITNSNWYKPRFRWGRRVIVE